MADWDAAAYHRVSDPQVQWGLAVLDRLRLAGDETVLDAGCGTGRLTADLAARLPRGHVVALDRSPAMARQAARRLAAPGSAASHRARTDVVLADLVALPFRQHFDVIFSTATFHWVLDQDRLAFQLAAALRHGGRLQAQCGGAGNLARVHADAAAILRRPPFAGVVTPWRDPWVFATPEEAAARLEAAGFAHVRAWLEERPTAFADPPSFRAFVAAVVLRPHLALLPPSFHDRFLDAVTAAAAASDPPLTLDYVRLNVEAEKSFTAPAG